MSDISDDYHILIKNEFKALTNCVLQEFKCINTQIYEQGVDIIQEFNIIQLNEHMKSLKLHLDVFASKIPCIKSGGSTGTTRRTPITTWWKKFYREIMTLNKGNITDSGLTKLGITQEIIDYVRLHKTNNKKTTQQKYETEGGYIWRELGVRVRKEKENKESTKDTWTRVKENIEDLRNTHKLNLDKKNFTPLQLENTTSSADNINVDTTDF